jgi:flagellar export protein FliJ
MRRFRFPLAALERLLAHREDEAKQRAAQAAAERLRAADTLDHLQARLAATQAERRGRRARGDMEPRDELGYHVYFERMARALGRQREALERASEAHEARQSELREAATRRRVLGLLRERRFAEHRRAALRDLTGVLDEVGARRSHYGSPSDPREPSPAA